MNTFFKKLDRAAERWVNIIDSQLQETTVQTITGQVFTHDQSVQACTENEGGQQQSALPTPAARSSRETRPTDTGLYPPVLRKARASHK